MKTSCLSLTASVLSIAILILSLELPAITTAIAPALSVASSPPSKKHPTISEDAEGNLVLRSEARHIIPGTNIKEADSRIYINGEDVLARIDDLHTAVKEIQARVCNSSIGSGIEEGADKDLHDILQARGTFKTTGAQGVMPFKHGGMQFLIVPSTRSAASFTLQSTWLAPSIVHVVSKQCEDGEFCRTTVTPAPQFRKNYIFDASRPDIKDTGTTHISVFTLLDDPDTYVAMANYRISLIDYEAPTNIYRIGAEMSADDEEVSRKFPVSYVQSLPASGANALVHLRAHGRDFIAVASSRRKPRPEVDLFLWREDDDNQKILVKVHSVPANSVAGLETFTTTVQREGDGGGGHNNAVGREVVFLAVACSVDVEAVASSSADSSIGEVTTIYEVSLEVKEDGNEVFSLKSHLRLRIPYVQHIRAFKVHGALHLALAAYETTSSRPKQSYVFRWPIHVETSKAIPTPADFFLSRNVLENSRPAELQKVVHFEHFQVGGIDFLMAARQFDSRELTYGVESRLWRYDRQKRVFVPHMRTEPGKNDVPYGIPLSYVTGLAKFDFNNETYLAAVNYGDTEGNVAEMDSKLFQIVDSPCLPV